ncbi:ACT domain-containing protein [Flavonifractor sp. HCP28S3_F3]|uniref:ACT domain-containing protein n=1 Tax=Flavonifractor sp. HCP28S3_F3 TaxID=3438939 RepID=UPI003F89B910
MGKTPNYFIVEASALPEVFLKVAEAKRLLETGEVDTVNLAARRVGISRSAFYKYKDAVQPFNDMLHGRIVTFQILLKDEPGGLSSVLRIFAQSGGNILTINQAIPVNGCAAVTIGAETSGLQTSLEELLEQVQGQEAVLRCEILAG